MTADAAGAAREVGGALRILIVDDHALFRRGLREVLEEEPDMEVVGEATGGEEALTRARALGSAGLDLVLLDVDMPGMDGISCAARLTAEHPNLLVVMLTVSTLDRDLFEAVRRGAVGYLSKSLSPDALLRALRGLRRDEALPMAPSTAAKLLAYFQGIPAVPEGAIEPQRASQRSGGRPETAGSAERTGTDVDDSAASLTPREREVLDHIARGARDREIAAALIVSESTVKKHVQNILRKLHARSRAEAVGRVRGAGAWR